VLHPTVNLKGKIGRIKTTIRPERGIKSETGQATSGKQKPPTGISQPGAELRNITFFHVARHREHRLERNYALFTGSLK
jgi:hypothetical protein